YLWNYIEHSHQIDLGIIPEGENSFKPQPKFSTNSLIDLAITQEGDNFKIMDLASSSSMTVMEQFLQVFHILSTDENIQASIQDISRVKIRIESALQRFQNALTDIGDDITRRNKGFKCPCSTCKPWVEELATLGV
ncbi:MAG TPA: hypothetical protein VJ044_04470, partial [Candidatus Hodarchaeales archaeon]|nr:hypothetical protein [Candidatus Hodarchaeales archaeon]